MKKSLSLLALKIFAIAGSPLLFPVVALAQYGGKDTVQGYIILILGFINFVILPLIFSIALLFFLINAARYFIIEAGDSGGREKAKRFALYGIGAFVILVSIWGIVNMFVNGLGFDNDNAMCPDYIGDWCDGGYDDSYYGSEYFRAEFNFSF